MCHPAQQKRSAILWVLLARTVVYNRNLDAVLEEIAYLWILWGQHRYGGAIALVFGVKKVKNNY